MKRSLIILISIIAVAAAIRLVVAIRCDVAPDYSDMAIYNELALSDHIVISPPPGYPLFLKAIYSIFGTKNYRAVFIVQALISTFTVFAAFLIGRKVCGERTGLIAAGIFAIYPNFIVYTLTTLTETLALLVTMLILGILVWNIDDRRKAVLAALTIFAGCFIRPAFLYFWPGTFLSVSRKKIFLITTGAVIAPAIIFMAISGNVPNRGALAFYKTYNPRATGLSNYDFSETELESRDLPISTYMRESFRFIAGNKWRTMDILHKKCSLLFSRGFDTFVMRNLVDNDPDVSNILYYGYLPVLILGVAGMLRRYNRKNRGVMWPALSYLVFFILLAMFKIRYRLLAEPSLIIFTSILLGGSCGKERQEDRSMESSTIPPGE
ncbi:MAG: glycosyltransferase family 39 protein [Candidatus Krumholzibacteria bacterium]|nr:glycosyltransferase family 39 protein [Candidatus Krumholzibacteria bacterium]